MIVDLEVRVRLRYRNYLLACVILVVKTSRLEITGLVFNELFLDRKEELYPVFIVFLNREPVNGYLSTAEDEPCKKMSIA